MKVAIMQPTYLPWIGYFNLMSKVDIFVFLDDVQFERRSWQQRNRILLNCREHFLTIPVKNMGRNQIIKNVRTDESQKWRKNHLNTLWHAYSKKEHFFQIYEFIENIFNENEDRLVVINTKIISYIKEKLQIPASLIFSSDIPVYGKKSQYLLNICKYFGADTYISPIGSKKYIEEEGIFADSGIEVIYNDYIPKPYPQGNISKSGFVPYLSVIDLIVNIGFDRAATFICEKSL